MTNDRASLELNSDRKECPICVWHFYYKADEDEWEYFPILIIPLNTSYDITRDQEVIE